MISSVETVKVNEREVVAAVRAHLAARGWRLTNLPKDVGHHGADIRAHHPRWRRILIVEAKGEGRTSKMPKMHNDFNAVLGQILSRMDKAGNSPKRARIYAIAFPHSYERVFAAKIAKMAYGWRLLKLRSFVVGEMGDVKEVPYSKYLHRPK